MSLRAALKLYEGKEVNIIMDGSGCATPGKLISVWTDHFEMETRWSTRQWFDLGKLSSFWCTEDPPRES